MKSDINWQWRRGCAQEEEFLHCPKTIGKERPQAIGVIFLFPWFNRFVPLIHSTGNFE